MLIILFWFKNTICKKDGIQFWVNKLMSYGVNINYYNNKLNTNIIINIILLEKLYQTTVLLRV